MNLPSTLRRALATRALAGTVLLREGAFAGTARRGSGEATPRGPLVGYVQSLLECERRVAPELSGVLGEAQSHLKKLPLLRFILNELLPELRRSSGKSGKSGKSGENEPKLSADEFRRLQKQARPLRKDLEQHVPRLDSTDEVADLIGVPCVILGRSVAPLSPVTGLNAGSPVFNVGGTLYAACLEQARPLSNRLRRVRKEEERRHEQSLRERPGLVEAAGEFVRDMKAILDRFGPRECGIYQLFHRDADHQLQHSRGHWILIRGPVTGRMGGREIFVSLVLRGHLRRNWLSVPLRAALEPGDFWSPNGQPLGGGLCMGDKSQYAGLRGDDLTNAQSVLEWLDAGVIVATGRSDQHRVWRAARQLTTG